MIRTTAIGLVSIIALGVSLASPAAGAHSGGGGAGGHPGGGGGAVHGAGAGGPISGAGVGHGSMMAMHSESSPGRLAAHDMGRMRMGGDRDHDHDHGRERHDHDHFRFFPAFAFGVNGYADTYDVAYGDCWELHRAWTHAGWRLRRYWVCD
jgi:hypothetical protein